MAAWMFVSGCWQNATVVIERLEPPIADVSGIREIAVLPLGASRANELRGQRATRRLAEVVASTGRYSVMKQDRVQALLSKAGVSYSYPPDAAFVRKIGSVLDVDAILCGELQNYQCNEESRAVKVKEPVWTGDYERDRSGNVISERTAEGELAPRKKFRRQWVEKKRIKRYAVLDLHLRVADAFAGNVISAQTVSESGSWEGTGSSEIAQLPTCDVIFELLSDRAIKKFVRQIAVHPVEEERALEYGIFHSTRLGVELAKNNMWDEAMDKWMQAIKAKPDDPAAFYDMGVGFERKGLFDLAYKSYQNALVRNTGSDRYIKAVARIQKLMKDLQ